ncbi:ferredoxin [Streptomyces sp. NPDC004232]|uniref:ferredoxin n=1 Tax=unclassified Streptomyces TaxID=2593676 RepID=UPI001DB6D8BF|nr:ferredoxin [Streptomyces sp. tea 10]
MRLVVDLNKCQGYAQCAFLAPDVFAMHGEESLIYNPHAPEEQRERLARAVAACPVQAITADGLEDLVTEPGTGPRQVAPEASDGR